MEALTYTAYGMRPENLKVQQVALPKRKGEQLTVKVHSAGLNPVDYKMLLGNYKQWAKAQFPATLGHDLCGEVIEADDTSSFKVGQLIYGCMEAGLPGSFATHCVINESCVSKPPEGYSAVELGCLPLVGMTCLQVFDQLEIVPGSRLLIHAGSGGVGTMAIQLAKQLGAYIYTTTSSKNEEWVKALGADEVICYDKEAYDQKISGLDAVFDTLGEDHTFRSLKLLRKGGRLVNIAGRPDHTTARQLGLPRWIQAFLWLKSRNVFRAAHRAGVAYSYVLMKSNTSDLERLAKMCEHAKIQVVVDRSYSLKEGIEAMEYLYSHRVKGKLVFDLTNS